MSYRETGRSLTVILLVTFLALTATAQQRSVSTEKAVTNEAASLSFSEFFEARTRGLKPSAKILGLNNKRVKLNGFMAQMEDAPGGSFFLVPRPIFCDEEGGGNADIPPEAVLVIVPFLSHQKIPFVAGPIEVSGVLELGNKEQNGRVSSIRLTMDQPVENGDQFSRSKRSSHQ